MNTQPIAKIDAARRQLDTAIKLYFENDDSLSIHTLAYASFKILFDIYPTVKGDGYADALDKQIQLLGWANFNRIPNFLKHADRDPVGLLAHHDADNVVQTIGFAAILYRQLTGSFTPVMRVFDVWIKGLYSEAFNFPPNPDPIDAALEEEATRYLLALPLAERLRIGRAHMIVFLKMWVEEKSKTVAG